MSATHTHSAGAVCGAHLSDADPAYRAWLPGRIADAVRCAVNNLAPAQVAWGSGSVPQHVFCRRLLVKPGVTYTNQLGFTNELAKMNWDSPHPADGEPTGPTDPEVFVAVACATPTDGPLALLANYSLHYVGDVGPGHISADYFGVFADRIQQLLGADRQDPPFVGILCNGTSGDINNINPKLKREPQPSYTQIRRVAEDLAQEVLRVTKGLEYRREVKLRAAQRECVRGDPPAECRRSGASPRRRGGPARRKARGMDRQRRPRATPAGGVARRRFRCPSRSSASAISPWPPGRVRSSPPAGWN